MSNLKTYLAEKYMSGAKAEAILSKAAPLKKKKRKVKETAQPLAGGTMIRDEDLIKNIKHQLKLGIEPKLPRNHGSVPIQLQYKVT